MGKLEAECGVAILVMWCGEGMKGEEGTHSVKQDLFFVDFICWTERPGRFSFRASVGGEQGCMAFGRMVLFAGLAVCCSNVTSNRCHRQRPGPPN